MKTRYALAPEAALDLFEIWRYIKEQSGVAMADQVEAALLDRMALLAASPGIGHRRKDLTEQDVRFFPVYSFLVIYRTGLQPMQILGVLHGRRDVEEILRKRL